MIDASPLRVMHFVSGGGTGSTRVALDLALAQRAQYGMQTHLVLRDKNRALPAAMIRQIEAAALPVHWVRNSWPRGRVVRQVEALCGSIRPDVFFAHGYSEHLWGRRAARAVPVVVHVEHNVERYWPWRVWAARRLAGATAATVCVSTAVERHVERLRIGSQRLLTLPNGIDTRRFQGALPIADRADDILMPARFARNKDQETLVRAVARLAERGWRGRLLLAGGGRRRHRRRCERLVHRLGLQSRVQFLGAEHDLPARLSACRVMALSSRREGLPLVIAEGMSAGCAVVASEIPGITDIVRAEGADANGWLFPAGDVERAADALWQALTDAEDAQRRADNGRRAVQSRFSLEAMAGRYDRLVRSLVGGDAAAARAPRIRDPA